MSDSTRFYLLSLAKTNFFDTIIISRINKKKSYRNFKKGGYLQLEKVFVTKDISPGGIRFYVQEFIPKDKILEIKISIGNPSFMLKAMVKVVWIKIELYNRFFLELVEIFIAKIVVTSCIKINYRKYFMN